VNVVFDGTIIVDINQSVYNRGYPIRQQWDGRWGAAQSFVPTLDTISMLELYIRVLGPAEFDLVIELREGHPEGDLIDTLILTPGDLTSQFQWITFDCVDTVVVPGVEYFIVLTPPPTSVTTMFGYDWAFSFENEYDFGNVWTTRNFTPFWNEFNDIFEFAFRTYGN